MKRWMLFNLDTEETLSGQFEPVNLTEEVSSSYSEKWALNRQNSIMQFVHGNTGTLSFEGRFFLQYGLDLGIKLTFGIEDADPATRLNILKQWAQRDTKLRRPPLLSFWVGDEAEINVPECVIDSISNINYRLLTSDGKIKDVSFTLNLRRYYPWLQESEAKKADTYHHYVKQGEYYELLTQQQYGDPMMGDVIRKRNPDFPNPVVGDRIPLPDYSKLKKEIIQPKSIPLKTGFGTQLTPQKELRLRMFELRSETYYSHVVLES